MYIVCHRFNINRILWIPLYPTSHFRMQRAEKRGLPAFADVKPILPAPIWFENKYCDLLIDSLVP